MRRAVLLFLVCLLCGRSAAAEPIPSKFVVFFQEWSAQIDDPAQAVIDRAAAYAKAHAGVILRVHGFADPTGSRRANELLTELRAQVVADRLAAAGVPTAHIRTRARGSVEFALSPQESRRVEISLGGR